MCYSELGLNDLQIEAAHGLIGDQPLVRCRLWPEGSTTMRDPKETPHPGDRFRCPKGTELEVTGVVTSLMKDRRETRCLYVNEFRRGHVIPTAFSIPYLKVKIKKAEILVRGSDVDPWPIAQCLSASGSFLRSEAADNSNHVLGAWS